MNTTTPGLLWVLRSIWKAREKISREEIEHFADQLDVMDRALLEQEEIPSRRDEPNTTPLDHADMDTNEPVDNDKPG